MSRMRQGLVENSRVSFSISAGMPCNNESWMWAKIVKSTEPWRKTNKRSKDVYFWIDCFDITIMIK